MKNLTINHLLSGGLITNYYCTSQCGHCLYGCSPAREKDYIDTKTTEDAIQKVLSLGCDALHIGGGEPMLDIPGLLEVADKFRDSGMRIHYVETNSSWFTDKNKTVQTLKQLKEHGISQLLISMSPFHNEHIPFHKPKGVVDACKKAGVQALPWIMDFYSDINAFDTDTTHSLSEYEQKYGDHYLQDIPMRYWTHIGGRAVYTFKDIFPLQSVKDIVKAPPCKELEDTSHFHVDLYGNYVPGLCSGLAIKTEDLGEPLKEDDYPIISMLYKKGIKRFLEYAKEEFGFVPKDEYLNKCHLCNDIRLFLNREKKVNSHELQPDGYYDQVDQFK